MLCIPRWKRQGPEPPRERASGKGSRGETPCAGLGGSPGITEPKGKREQKKPEFPGGMLCIPRWKRQGPHTAREAASSDGLCAAQGMRPHPASLRSATFPRGEGYDCKVCPRWKRLVPRIAREAASSDGRCAAQEMRPHPASLRSATFPRGEGYDCKVCPRWKRLVRSPPRNAPSSLPIEKARHMRSFHDITKTGVAILHSPEVATPVCYSLG